MRAALEHLVARAGGRRTVAILGEMAELGPDSPRYHEEIGTRGENLGVDVVIGVGELARSYGPRRLVCRCRRRQSTWPEPSSSPATACS